MVDPPTDHQVDDVRRAYDEARRQYGKLPEWAEHAERQGWVERRLEKHRRRKARRSRQKHLNNIRKNISAAKRQRVYERDGFQCVECGATERLTLDHIVPLARAGTNAYANLQTMCETCNVAKGCR